MRAFFARSLPENPYLLGLLLAFVAVFVIAVFRQWRPSMQAEQERMAHLPLQD